MDISKTYDTIIASELEKRLNRKPSKGELINADTDADLVNETLWQLVVQLNERISTLENKKL